MAVRVQAGAESLSYEAFIGQTVADIRKNVQVIGLFNLQGGEEAQVLSNASGQWENKGDGYTLQDGDQLKFSRVAGVKG